VSFGINLFYTKAVSGEGRAARREWRPVANDKLLSRLPFAAHRSTKFYGLIRP
jgi:hypothetical protein